MNGWSKASIGPPRTSRFDVAGALLILAGVGYSASILIAIPSGSFAFSFLGGSVPTSVGQLVAIFGPLAALSGFLAREFRNARTDENVTIGFVAWFIVAALAAVLIDPILGAQIALTGLVPLAIVWPRLRAGR